MVDWNVNSLVHCCAPALYSEIWRQIAGKFTTDASSLGITRHRSTQGTVRKQRTDLDGSSTLFGEYCASCGSLDLPGRHADHEPFLVESDVAKIDRMSVTVESNFCWISTRVTWTVNGDGPGQQRTGWKEREADNWV
jgi:hypothetical protein